MEKEADLEVCGRRRADLEMELIRKVVQKESKLLKLLL